MTAYENEIFQFLTIPNNFDSFVRMISHYENVKRELITRFWTAVRNELLSMTKDSVWRVTMDNNLFATYSKIYLYKDHWMDNGRLILTIAWESLSNKPYRGLLLYMDTKGINMSEIRAAAIQFRPNDFTTDSNQWWAWWQYGNADFNNASALGDILPDKIDIAAKTWANELYELAISCEHKLDGLDLSKSIIIAGSFQ